MFFPSGRRACVPPIVKCYAVDTASGSPGDAGHLRKEKQTAASKTCPEPKLLQIAGADEFTFGWCGASRARTSGSSETAR
jgi:hypothetical protein